MPAFCLDTSAILTLRDDEPGAERVATLLHKDPEFEAITELDQSWLA